MQTHGLLVGLAWLTSLFDLFRGDDEPAKPPPPPLSEIEGAALIARLVEPTTRCRAYFDLSIHANTRDWKDFAAFQESHPSLDLVVCPQTGGQPPLYLMLHDLQGQSPHYAWDGYRVEKPEELFKDDSKDSRFRSWNGFAVEVFDHQGVRLDPFEGNTVFDDPGVLADINGDGLIERVDSTCYGVKGIGSAKVLEVSVVEKVERPILRVLYNWDTEDWACRLTDSDQDGVLDIEFGPTTVQEQEQTVVYRWNGATQSYDGPPGGAGDHVRVLAPKDVHKQLARLHKQGLAFPPDPGLTGQGGLDDGPWAKRGLKKPKPDEVSRPYRHQSLMTLSPKELMRYMGEGKSMQQLETEAVLKTQLPEGFWGLDAKEAALAMAQVNRYPDHQRRYRLALDARDGAKPPEVGSLAFSYSSARCYHAVDEHYFLRFDPRGSYLAFAQSRDGGVVFYNLVHNRPAYDLRRCELPYEEARKIAHTIWWLDRVRSQEHVRSNKYSSSSSSADGHGSLVVRPDVGGPSLQLRNTIWAGHAAERWTAEYEPEVCLNLASFLIQDALPMRLGEAWTAQQPRHSHDILARQSSSPKYEEEERLRIRARIREFLASFGLDQARVSFAILGEAIRAVGELCVHDHQPRLREILEALPVRSTPKRSAGDVRAELDKLDESDVAPDSIKQHMEKRDELRAEYVSLLRESRSTTAADVREALTLSIRKLESAKDTLLLRAWACSKEEGAQWALQRLGALDKREYASALVWWLEHYMDDGARQVYEEIARVDPPLAQEIAANLPADQVSALSVSAFSELEKIADIPDKAIRVRTLIDLLLTPTSQWDERRRALDILVPEADPLRYPEAVVDQALLTLLEPEQADDTINFILVSASQALARRGRTQSFDRIVLGLKGKHSSMVEHQMLGPLAHLAQADPAKLKPRLQEVVHPHLQRTNWYIPEIFWAIWAADLRELKPRLEQLATSGPDDHEDSRANRHGGEETAVQGRFHLARKMVSIWNEEDLPSRAKLLLALAKTEEGAFDEPASHPERRARLEVELKRIAGELTTDGREEVRRFLQSSADPRTGQEAQDAKRPPALLDLMRLWLQL
jgi:hypothetical protein